MQEVEYVKEEAKMVYLLECLQKTPPPVSTFTCYDMTCTKNLWLKHVRCYKILSVHIDRC